MPACKSRTEPAPQWTSLARAGNALYVAGAGPSMSAVAWRTSNETDWVDISPPATMGLADLVNLKAAAGRPELVFGSGQLQGGGQLIFIRSTNAGASWAAEQLPQSCSPVSAIGPLPPVTMLIAPSDPDRAYVLCTGVSSLETTTNAGVAWSQASIPLQNGTTSFAVDPLQASRLFASGFQDAATSTNGGADWIPSFGPFRSDFAAGLVSSFASPFVLFASPLCLNGPNLAARSIGDAVSWQVIRVEPIPHHFCLGEFVTDPLAPGTVYAIKGELPLDRSTDGGATWSGVANNLPAPPTALVADPVTEGTLFAIAAGRLYESLDSGAHWAERAPPNR